MDDVIKQPSGADVPGETAVNDIAYLIRQGWTFGGETAGLLSFGPTAMDTLRGCGWVAVDLLPCC